MDAMHHKELILGDCLEEMQKLEGESVDLIYLDPPFFTQREHAQKTRDNSKEYTFEDKWDTLEDYLNFIKGILLQSKRLLKLTGSIFLHCDKQASHYLRVLLDQVFRSENFQSEIIWSYKRWSNSKKGLLNSHQNIYFYSKSSDFKFNATFMEYSPTTNLDQILQERVRDSNGKSQYRKDENGNTVLGKEKKGVPLNDIWEIPFLNPKAKERAGYPTQKPILLMERIISIVTDRGDFILDPLCGSGTTLVSAKILNRNYLGIDKSQDAINLAKKRLANIIKTESRLLEKGSQEYVGKSEKELAILKCIGSITVQRNKGIDGFLKKYYQGKPVAVRIQKNDETLEEAKVKLIDSAKSKGCKLMILIKTNDLRNITLSEKEEHKDLVVINSPELDINKRLNRD